MPRAFDIIVAVSMILCGSCFLALLPKYQARLTELERAGRRTKDQVRAEIKKFRLVALCSLVLGAGIICKLIFNL